MSGILRALFGEKTPFEEKNIVEEMKLEDLKDAEIQLKIRVKNIHTEIEQLENKEKQLLEDARSPDTTKALLKSFSGQITNVRQQKDAKLNTQAEIQTQLRTISNFIIIKEKGKDLPENVQRILLKTPPEKMETRLAELRMSAQIATEQRELLSSITNEILNIDIESSDSDEGILPELLPPKKEPMELSKEIKNKPKIEFE